MKPAFWQALLAAELTPHKASSLVRELAFSPLDPLLALRTHSSLSPAERSRCEGANQIALTAALERGVVVMEAPDLPDGTSDVTPAVFLAGEPALLKAPRVGIVGTRGASTYGKAAAMKFAEYLARAGCTIVSGGALGIDAAAHRGAMSVEGRTCAVLGSGIDVVYPAVHRNLFNQMVSEGHLLVSQFAVGTKPSRYTFLSRNQLIARLSQVLLVIEAPERSGALSTANAAIQSNRHVCVVPANISYESFRGSHALVRDGAILVDHPDQVLELLGIEPQIEPVRAELSEIQRRLLEVIQDASLPVDKIIDKTKLDPTDVMSELTMLEMEGLVIRDEIGYTRRP